MPMIELSYQRCRLKSQGWYARFLWLNAACVWDNILPMALQVEGAATEDHELRAPEELVICHEVTKLLMEFTPPRKGSSYPMVFFPKQFTVGVLTPFKGSHPEAG